VNYRVIVVAAVVVVVVVVVSVLQCYHVVVVVVVDRETTTTTTTTTKDRNINYDRIIYPLLKWTSSPGPQEDNECDIFLINAETSLYRCLSNSQNWAGP
jgi:hypothetical protein